MQDVTREIDITSDICPMTFVRTRLALDKMAPGETLLVRLKGRGTTAQCSAHSNGTGPRGAVAGDRSRWDQPLVDPPRQVDRPSRQLQPAYSRSSRNTSASDRSE